MLDDHKPNKVMLINLFFLSLLDCLSLRKRTIFCKQRLNLRTKNKQVFKKKAEKLELGRNSKVEENRITIKRYLGC